MAEKTVRKQLVEALEGDQEYLPTCKDPDCGPRFPYTPKCPFMKNRAAIDRARAEPEEPCRHDRHRAKENERTRARAEAQGEPAGRGTA